MRGSAQGLISNMRGVILKEPFSMRPFGPTNSFGQETLEYLLECEGKEKECQHSGFLSVYAAAPRFSVLD